MYTCIHHLSLIQYPKILPLSEVKDVNVKMSREVLAPRQNRHQFRLINIIMAPLKVGMVARTQASL